MTGRKYGKPSPRQRSVSIPSLIPKPTSKPRNWKNTWVCRVLSLAVDLVQLETVSSLGPPSPIVCPGRRTKVRSIKRFYSSSTPGLDQIRYDKSYKTVGSNKGFREYVFSTGLQLPSETKSYIVSLKDRLRRPPGLVIERRWRLQACSYKRGVVTECKMSIESRTLAPESPIRPMYFKARITRISYTLGNSYCDPLGGKNRERILEGLQPTIWWLKSDLDGEIPYGAVRKQLDAWLERFVLSFNRCRLLICEEYNRCVNTNKHNE